MSAFQSTPPPEIGRVMRARGITEAEARSGRGCGALVVAVLVAGSAWAATQFIPMGIRMDTTVGFAISTAVALVLGGAVFLSMRFLGKAEEDVTFLGEHGLARMTASKGVVELMALAPFAQVSNVTLQMARRGKRGITLVKIWTFVDADGKPLIALSGRGTMNRWSGDPAKATPDDNGWAFAESAIAQWQALRSAGTR